MIETVNPIAFLPLLTTLAAVAYFVGGRARWTEVSRVKSMCGLLCTSALALCCLVPFLRLGLVIAVPAVTTFGIRTVGGFPVLPRPVRYALDASVALAALAVPAVFALAYFEA